MSLIIRAAQFAAKAHEGQVRKYTGRPYIEHPLRVMAKMAAHPRADEDLVAAAALHDVCDDCGVKSAELFETFNPYVGAHVFWLTNPSKGLPDSRAVRKALDREHIAKAIRPVQVIKLIDRLDNLEEFRPEQDPKFCDLYCDESELLLQVIGGADVDLAQKIANRIGLLRAWIEQS